jgi:hypothetical protein
MIRADQIPDEVECAFRKAWMDGTLTAKGAIAAAINAWPDMEMRPTFNPSRIILPLTQDNTDD